MKIKMKLVLFMILMLLNIVLNMRISLTKIKNNSNEMLTNQVSTEEKTSIQATATSQEKSAIKPVDPTKSAGKTEEELYELERANAMAEMIF
jgi:hypothetical protein